MWSFVKTESMQKFDGKILAAIRPWGYIILSMTLYMPFEDFCSVHLGMQCLIEKKTHSMMMMMNKILFYAMRIYCARQSAYA